MKFVPVHIAGGGRLWHFDFYNQWPAVLAPGRFNWIDFTIIDLSFEVSPYKRSREFTVGLLGFSVTITRCDREDEEPTP